MIADALARKESCGCHFNEAYQTEENEAKCEADCPKEISITNIARLNREFLKSGFFSSTK